jgi:hypothetical protein
MSMFALSGQGDVIIPGLAILVATTGKTEAAAKTAASAIQPASPRARTTPVISSGPIARLSDRPALNVAR